MTITMTLMFDLQFIDKDHRKMTQGSDNMISIVVDGVTIVTTEITALTIPILDYNEECKNHIVLKIFPVTML